MAQKMKFELIPYNEINGIIDQNIKIIIIKLPEEKVREYLNEIEIGKHILERIHYLRSLAPRQKSIHDFSDSTMDNFKAFT